ncbi:hybrid sensor histidine kinase/response regulator [Archangium lipolyticum]|uniref:hybrid sensor histidine kinase/response regulator n=1 Tax=Archangium lipolyticum TaxID=2970465 RepID=UPI00214A4C99|nr:PAS domain S-box protein [Archangium lipolyticum]
MRAPATQARDTFRLRALLDDARRLVWVVDEAGRMQEPSPSWAAFTGQSPERMLGRHWLDSVHPEERERLEPGGASLANDEELACRVRRADGSWRDVLVRALPVKDEAERLVEWLFLAEEVTGSAGARQSRAETALRESEERFRSVVQTSTASIWTTNAQGVPVEDSPSWRAFTGCSLEQWLDGSSWMQAIHPEDRPRIDEVWRRSLATKTPYEVEGRIRHVDGSWRWVQARAVPVFNPDGTVREWVGTTADISERKASEEERNQLLSELGAKERLLSAILDQMPSGFILAGPHGELKYANAQAEKIWGHPLIRAEDIQGYSAYHHFRPDGTVPRPEDLPLARSLMHGEVVRDQVLWLSGQYGGDDCFIRANSAPIRDEHGRTIAAVAIFDNITEARRAEERAARLLSVTSALSRALTPGDVARIVLTEALGAMGADAGAVYRRREDETLESLHDVGCLEEMARHLTMAEAVREGRELWLRTGVELDRCLSVLPMAVDGQSIGALVLSFPGPRTCGSEELRFMRMLAQQCGLALERARLYEVAEAERERAEQASRLKDDFLCVLSHELRTPLTAILGWTQILRTRELPPDKRVRALETIERNARAQTQLIEDLLDVNRIVSGKLRLDLRPTHPVKLIESALDVVRPAAEAKGLHLQARLDARTGPLLGDPDRLQQIVWNLLSNAVKFTPEGGCVTVTLSQGPSHVELQVCDTGDGISPGFQKHLFERFRQADASSTRRYGGLGLGLSIVRHLVELHGGTVEAHSDGKGRGSTFTVRLPLVAPRPGTAEPARTPLQVPPCLPTDVSQVLRGRHILVVDDETDSRELIATLLQEVKARVSTAASAAQALELLSREPPELLISDIGMPEMDGYAFIREVRGRAPGQGGRLPSMAITAYARREDRDAALLAGFDSHVSKPLEASELLRVAASLLAR